MLLDTANIDAAAEDVCGLTALQLSAFKHHGDVERLLLAYDVPIVSDVYGLHESVSQYNNIVIVSSILVTDLPSMTSIATRQRF